MTTPPNNQVTIVPAPAGFRCVQSLMRGKMPMPGSVLGYKTMDVTWVLRSDEVIAFAITASLRAVPITAVPDCNIRFLQSPSGDLTDLVSGTQFGSTPVSWSEELFAAVAEPAVTTAQALIKW